MKEIKSFIYEITPGNESIYSDPGVYELKIDPQLLETPKFEDTRGIIERRQADENKYNILTTYKGFMRSGDLHKNTQLDLVLSGKIELWTLENGRTKKGLIEPNQYIVIGRYGHG